MDVTRLDQAKGLEDLRQEASHLSAQRQRLKPSTLRTDQLLEELQVYQIELAMQNESLRQAQLDLAQSRDRYRDLYDFAPVGYMTLSRADAILEINLTGSKLLGRTRSELMTRFFASFVAREDADRWYLFLMEALKTDELTHVDLTLLLLDAIPLSVRLECGRLSVDGKVVGLRIAFTDVSVQKQMEEELRIAAITFEASQESMMVTDNAGVILRVNSAFTGETGYTALEMVGKTPALLKSGRHDQQFYKHLWESLKEQGSGGNDLESRQEWQDLCGVVDARRGTRRTRRHQSLRCNLFRYH